MKRVIKNWFLKKITILALLTFCFCYFSEAIMHPAGIALTTISLGWLFLFVVANNADRKKESPAVTGTHNKAA